MRAAPAGAHPPLTLEGLRKQIRPVAAGGLPDFLAAHQHLLRSSRLGGREGVQAAIEQLQGFETGGLVGARGVARAGARLSLHIDLDDLLSRRGRSRGAASRRRAATPTSCRPRSPMTRVVPISVVLREDLAWLLPGERRPSASRVASAADATSTAPEADRPAPAALSLARPASRRVYETLAARGALFPAELTALVRMLPAQLEDALGELTALGLVAADGWASIRAIVSPDQEDRAYSTALRRRAGARAVPAVHAVGPVVAVPGTGGAGAGAGSARGLGLAADGPVRRRVPRPACARDRVAPGWRPPQAPVYRADGGARGDPRRPLRGGRLPGQFALSEAVDRHCVRSGTPRGGGSRSPRKAFVSGECGGAGEPGRHPDAGRAHPGERARTACCSAAAVRWPRWWRIA